MTITRVLRGDVELSAVPNLTLQFGDGSVPQGILPHEPTTTSIRRASVPARG